MTGGITALPDAGGWAMHGKTGTGFPLLPDGLSDHAPADGWIVGWATKGSRTLVFVRQTQDGSLQDGPAGLRARDAYVPALPALLAGL